MPKTVVAVRARIPLSTTARIHIATTCRRLGATRLAQRVASRLAYDVKVGNGRWQRRHLVGQLEKGV